MRRAMLAVCLLSSCGSDSGEPTRLATLPVTLPNGQVIRAELAVTPADQQRGLMFRTELAAGRGMLFAFTEPGLRPFWMYRTLIPLDILWLDSGRRIVFISANTPPCRSEDERQCPNYGGGQPSQYVLELAAGAAAANGLKVGDELRF